jgi:hypothetical protein
MLMVEQKRTKNESDVREDVAMPLLLALGYAAGTVNHIIREKALEYSNSSLGRKKRTDPPLRGRADYILTVLGAGSWTLEIKAEDVEIDRNAIEQAITYAGHPEVSGSYAAILNGIRFVVFHNTQRSDERPLIDLQVGTIAALASALESTLSPTAIRLDCSPPKVDLETSVSNWTSVQCNHRESHGSLRQIRMEYQYANPARSCFHSKRNLPPNVRPPRKRFGGLDQER